MSLTLKFRYRFEAAHRFTSSAAPSCRTPHGHTWYATAVFELTSPSLDKSAMAAEFGKTKSAWKRFITETVDHSFMHNVDDPLVTPMRKLIPDARLLPFPTDPTTEMIAGLFAVKLKAMHAATGIKTIRPKAVVIGETPTNTVSFRFEKDGSEPAWLKQVLDQNKGWWNSPDPGARE